MNFWNFVNTRYCNVAIIRDVAIITLWVITIQVFICHIHKHKHARTHAHTHIHTHKQNEVFNKNIRSNKDSGQIERNKLKYLHYDWKTQDEEQNDWKTQDEDEEVRFQFHSSSQNYISKVLPRF